MAAVAREALGQWRGALELEFDVLELAAPAAPARTVIAARRHEGPFCIQRPFYPEGNVCHVYLLHPPGGLAGRDRLELDAACAPGAHALLTTPAATKFYRSEPPAGGSGVLGGSGVPAATAASIGRRGGRGAAAAPTARSGVLGGSGVPAATAASIGRRGGRGAEAVVRQTLRVAAGATLEWLPLETILFGGSHARIETEIELDTEARFIGWEVTALGRPLSGDRYATGTLDQRTRVLAGGAVLLEERLRLCAGERLLTAPWGLAGFKVCGTLYAYPAGITALEGVRARLPARSRDAAAAATRLGPLLVVRCLAQQVERVREIFESLWAELRPLLLARPPCAPRIWQT